MNIQVIKIQDIIDGKEKSPFPLEVIPNNMGINLVSVDSITLEKQDDGQIKKLTINFIPNNN